MEWERAKTFILLFFVLLNLTLGGLLLLERRRYDITPEREQAIIAIMERNNITMDARLLRRFTPMRTINIAGFSYDIGELAGIFFGDAYVRPVATAHGYVLTHGTGELVVAHGFVSYDNPEGHGGREDWIQNLNAAQAQLLTDAFVSEHWTDFRLDDVFIGQDWIRLSYRQVFRGYVIHTNFIELVVTERGIVQIDMQYGRVLGWDGDRQPIAAPDEALLTFVQRMRAHALALDSPMVITHMDLVYFQEDFSPDPDGTYRAEPAFRVFIAGDAGDPFLINAFRNEVIY